MGPGLKREKLYAFIFSVLLLCHFSAFSQLTVGLVDSGPYTPGSSIAAPFSSVGVNFKTDNKFELFLSDENGNFVSTTPIGKFEKFYSTFVNGIIPATAVPGTQYKLKITSNSPVLSAVSTPFEIKAGGIVTAEIKSFPIFNASVDQGVFGYCISKDGAEFILSNNSSAGATVTGTITNELTNITEPAVNFSTDIQFNAHQAHYTIVSKAQMPDGTMATRAYMIVNNPTVNSFQTNGNGIVCLPGGTLQYGVGYSAMKNNFPGNTYNVLWGDGKMDTYTLSDFSMPIMHEYTETSCGSPPYVVNGVTTYNVFGINISGKSPYCSGDVGSAINTTAKVVSKPKNEFTYPPFGCSGSEVTFTNTSTPGQDPTGNSQNCEDNNVRYNWYVDNVLIKGNALLSDNFKYTFSKGTYTIRLESVGSYCEGDPISHVICVQDKPIPKFDIPKNVSCGPFSFTPTDQSVIDNSCTPTTYTWSVFGSPAGTSVVNPHSTAPTFTISNPGRYTIRLQLSNGTPCGDVHIDTSIVVNTFQQPTLSNNVTLCTPTSYTFNKTTGPTKTTYSGTIEGLDDSFKWTVVGGDFEFAQGTSDTSRYPVILFKEFKSYTVKVVATTICGDKEDSQIITFLQSPVPKITAAKTTVCFDDKIDLTGVITNSTPSTTFTWEGDGGTFSSTTLNTQYTPTAAEKTKGSATIRLMVETGLSGACAKVSDEITVTIYPENTHTNTSQSICSETIVNYMPVSAIAGSTFTWTAISNPLITGASASGTGPITDKLTNTSEMTAATVTYTITATFNGCTGPPFTHTVTVNPLPVITATAAKSTICSMEKAGITHSSTTPATKFSWTAILVSGTASGFRNQTTPISATTINDVLVNTSSADAVVRYTITPIAGGCPGSAKDVEITVAPGVTQAAAGPDQILCNQLTTQLAGNLPTVGTGEWSGMGVTFDDATKYNAKVSNMQPGQTYLLTWTITGNNGCDSKDVVELKNLAGLTNVLHTNSTTYCSGQSIVITGDLPTGGDGAYTYTWESSLYGTTWSTIAGKNTLNLTHTVVSKVQIRRVVNSSACTLISNVVIINVLPPIGNNILSAGSSLCAGVTPALITGSQPTGGDGTNYRYIWETSSDNGATFTTIGNATSNDYQPPAVTQTTLYRRLISSDVCAGAQANTSAPVTIALNAPAIAEFKFTTDIGCLPFKLDGTNIKAVPHLAGNGTYEWFADNVSIGTGINFPGYTITEAGKTVKIKLVVVSSLGCTEDSLTHSFSTNDTFTAAFTQDQTEGCGTFAVQFTNTSSSLTNATFLWDFGNGTTSHAAVPPPITFLPDVHDGLDKTYTVTLTATSPCSVQKLTSIVLVKANPHAAFSPDKTLGCSPFAVNFTNTSLGRNLSFTYDFGDRSPVITTKSLSDISHVYTVTEVTDFTVKMTASNECNTDSIRYIIRVSPNTIRPELVVNGNKLTGCAPFTVNFGNNTEGASAYTYNFGDGSIINTNKAPEVVQHTFTTPGVYTVTLFATNGCSSASTTETITVLEQPITAFTANKTIGCSGLLVQFKNQSVNGVSYLWDFGDGATSIEFEPTHIFTGPGKNFTVSLTTINSLGCPTTVTKSELIQIVTNPVSQFTVLPGNQLKYPDFTFDFKDISTDGAVRWEWDFGDQVISTLQNPTHTYRELGSYTVQLTVTNKEGCTAQSIQVVAVLGVPDLLTVPNAFMPGSEKTELRTFMAKGKGIAEWRMTVFNKWGQVLWETTKLQDDAPMDGWDGTFKGQPQPQGTYFWRIDVTFINGAKWKGVTYDGTPPKTTGVIYLIR